MIGLYPENQVLRRPTERVPVPADGLEDQLFVAAERHIRPLQGPAVLPDSREDQLSVLSEFQRGRLQSPSRVP